MLKEIKVCQSEFRRILKEVTDLTLRKALMEEALIQRMVTYGQVKDFLERKCIEIEIERMEDDFDLLTAATALAIMRKNRASKLLIEDEE